MISKQMLDRIAALEAHAGYDAPLSFDDFLVEWKGTDGLSQSLFCLAAADLDFAGGGRFGRYIQHIAPYLRRMGLVDDAAPTIREIAEKYERERLSE
jgi:hypothetical protein